MHGQSRAGKIAESGTRNAETEIAVPQQPKPAAALRRRSGKQLHLQGGQDPSGRAETSEFNGHGTSLDVGASTPDSLGFTPSLPLPANS